MGNFADRFTLNTTAASPATAVRCRAYGCPLPANGNHDQLCRYHQRRPAGDWQALTERLNRLRHACKTAGMSAARWRHWLYCDSDPRLTHYLASGNCLTGWQRLVLLHARDDILTLDYSTASVRANNVRSALGKMLQNAPRFVVWPVFVSDVLALADADDYADLARAAGLQAFAQSLHDTDRGRFLPCWGCHDRAGANRLRLINIDSGRALSAPSFEHTYDDQLRTAC